MNECRMSFVGRIRLDRGFICAEPDIAHLVLAQGIVIRAEADFYSDSIDYVMYSPHLFRDLGEGEMVPTYEITVFAAEDGTAMVTADEIKA